jgi:hydroxyacylglutathione hydrolase
MPHLAFHPFICRSDNYGLLVHDHKSGATASVDAPDAAAIEQQLSGLGWRLTHIFTTHHHGDHVEGNLALKQKFGCTIIGPRAEADRIPGIDTQVAGGDSFSWAGQEVRVMDCPGHTKGHIAFHMPAEDAKILRRENGPSVFMAGLLPAAFSLIPIVNLAVPLFATAYFTHLFKSVRASSA